MKKILPIMLSLLFLLCACGRTEEVPQPTEPEVIQTSPAETEATEPEVTEDPSQEAEGETQTPGKTGSVYRLVRLTALDGTGSESWHQEYIYDDYGREIQTAQYMDGVITYSYTRTYTSGTEYSAISESGGDLSTIRCTLDDAGRALYRELSQDGAIVEISEFSYDQHGNQLSVRTVYDGDESVYAYEYTYDADGNMLSRQEYLNGEAVGRLDMEYDAQGREIASAYSYPDDTPGYCTESTWEGSTETRISYDSEGNAYMTLITTYDETGNILSQETWQEGELISCTEYTYELIEIIAE